MEALKQLLDFTLLSIKGYEVALLDVLLIMIGYISVRLIIKVFSSKITRLYFNRNNIDDGRRASLLQIIRYTSYAFFFYFSLHVVGVDLSLFMAGSAALLFGVGIGVQQIFSDLVSGIIMLFEGNVKVGDMIEVGETLGRVESVGLRTSKIFARDGRTMVVPNSKFIVDNVVNLTNMQREVRFMVSVGVAYGSDVQLVKHLLLECAHEHPQILKTKDAFVRFVDFGNSSLDFHLYFWVSDIWNVEDTRSDLRFSIDEAFRKHHVVIPFPQRDLHIRSSDVAVLPQIPINQGAKPINEAGNEASPKTN